MLHWFVQRFASWLKKVLYMILFTFNHHAIVNLLGTVIPSHAEQSMFLKFLNTYWSALPHKVSVSFGILL